ncbi:MAG: PhzF family phenazine biosynthesis protein [Ilumatobacteraceae bacterium]
MLRPFRQIDVFTDVPYAGNPVAVVLDGDGLDDDAMRRFARWTNLSETTFVLPPTNPEADYRVRIFTTTMELPFAGHPTLGTCHAWLAAGGSPRRPDVTVQECPAGLVPVRRTPAGLAFAAPPQRRSGPVDDGLVAEITAAFGMASDAVLAAEWVDNGPGWLALLLDSADAVLAVRPRYVDQFVGLVGPHRAGSPCAVEVRAFVPERGAMTEDPATGSLNASVAQWLIGAGRLAAPYVASQGTVLGRSGRVHVTADDDLWIGGGTITCIEGTVDL